MGLANVIVFTRNSWNYYIRKCISRGQSTGLEIIAFHANRSEAAKLRYWTVGKILFKFLEGDNDFRACSQSSIYSGKWVFQHSLN
jgi:hypothetical protein